MKWASLGFPFLKRSLFLTGGLGTVFFLRKRCLCITTLESRCLWAVTVQIRVSCIFLENMFRSLARLRVGWPDSCPVVLAGFSVDSVSHLGPWNLVLDLLGFPPGSSTASANGALLQRYRTTPFASRLRSWSGCGLWSGVGPFQQA